MWAVFIAKFAKSDLSRKRKRDPKFPGFVVVVRDKDQFDEAISAPKSEAFQIMGFKHPSRFDSILQERMGFYQSRASAYEYAYSVVDVLKSQNHPARIYDDSEEPDSRVYCIRLDSSVWNNRSFRQHNQHIAKKDQSQTPAYYVGQTRKTIKARYTEHRNEDSSKSTFWGKRFFLSPFKSAFDEKMLARFHTETGNAIRNLHFGESIIIESRLAEWLQDHGYGAYYG